MNHCLASRGQTRDRTPDVYRRYAIVDDAMLREAAEKRPALGNVLGKVAVANSPWRG